MNFKLIGLTAFGKEKKHLKLSLIGEEKGKIEYVISEGTYRGIGCPLSGEMLPQELLDKIAKEDEELRAYRKAVNILSYADNSRTRLTLKLKRAGFSSAAVESTVASLIRAGFLDDARQVKLRALGLWRDRHYGPYRIIKKLTSEGYSASAAKAAISELRASAEIDFEYSRNAIIEKYQPQNYEEKQKLLYKYGYLYD